MLTSLARALNLRAYRPAVPATRGAVRRLGAVATALFVAVGVTAVSAPASAEPVVTDVLLPGESMLHGDSLVSPNSWWELTLSGPNGSLTVTQQASSWDPDGVYHQVSTGIAELVLQEDGNLVGYREDGYPLFVSGTAGRDVAGLVLDDGGRAVLVAESGAELFVFGWTPSELAPRSVLFPGDYLVSPRGNGVLVMQEDGNLVYYRAGRAQWWSGTAGTGSTAFLGDDGNLVVHDDSHWPVYQTGTGPGFKMARLRVEEHELSLYQYGGYRDTAVGALWGTAWTESEVAAGDQLDLGDRRQSSDGRCVLALQYDQNLVQYCDGRALWSTRTASSARLPAHLAVQTDGNVVHYGYWATATQIPRWWTGTNAPGSRLVVQDDGNVVVYAPNGTPTWSRATGRLR